MHTGQSQLKAIRIGVHPFCLVCSGSNPYGLGVEFSLQRDGSISASFLGHAALEGYPGLLHGGVVASLLDGAMTNCLFAHGLVAVTAELKVRYRKPVVIGRQMVIRAWIQARVPPLYLMQGELSQDGCAKATAAAKFMKRPEWNSTP